MQKMPCFFLRLIDKEKQGIYSTNDLFALRCLNAKHRTAAFGKVRITGNLTLRHISRIHSDAIVRDSHPLPPF